MTDDDKEISGQLTLIQKMLNKLLPKEDKVEIEIVKQFDEKTHTVQEPLYMPFGKMDAHGDAYRSKDDVYQLVENLELHKQGLQKAINHKHQTKCFDIVKAWVNEDPISLDGVEIAALQPMVELKYTDAAFELRKAGKLLGPSIGCSASAVNLLKGLKDLSMEQRAKRFISDFDFSQNKNHLSLTTPSVGGPCSMEDWFVEVDLNKSMSSAEDMAVLEALDEEYVELEKKRILDESTCNQEDEAPSTSVPEAQDAGVDNTTLNKGKETDMSKEQVAEMVELKKQVAILKAEKDLGKYGFEQEVVDGLATVLADVESKTSIIKALDVLVGRIDVAKVELNKAKEDAESAPAPRVASKLENDMSTPQGESSDESIGKGDKLTDVDLKKMRDIAQQG